MAALAYPAAREVASTLEAYFARLLAAAGVREPTSRPDAGAIETIVDTTFWASLRREEGFAPRISLAFIRPEEVARALRFERPLPFTAEVLSRLAPAVDRPGIHLCISRDQGELRVWGTARTIPRFCFVLEVVEPGLLVVKHRRAQDPGKFVNVVVLKGDEIKVVDEHPASLAACPALLTPLIDFSAAALGDRSVNVLVQLAVSMRAHGRGGSLLVVPTSSGSWHDSIVQPISYLVEPPFLELADLMRREEEERSQQLWQESLFDAVEAMAGLTAVDGAALITEGYELLAFGAKIARRRGGAQVEQVIVTEPIVGDIAAIVHPLQLGGTRHLSAAQFVQDQPDAVALVASQDGRFTVFAWSACEAMVHAHRVETLLL